MNLGLLPLKDRQSPKKTHNPILLRLLSKISVRLRIWKRESLSSSLVQGRVKRQLKKNLWGKIRMKKPRLWLQGQVQGDPSRLSNRHLRCHIKVKKMMFLNREWSFLNLLKCHRSPRKLNNKSFNSNNSFSCSNSSFSNSSYYTLNSNNNFKIRFMLNNRLKCTKNNSINNNKILYSSNNSR